jgi:GNAT superfamily N-acetyltransferase
MTANSLVGKKCFFEPVNLHIQDEFDELTKQRKLCGWDSDADCLRKWQRAIEQKSRLMFWIIPLHSIGTTEFYRRIGHISIVSECDPPNLELANPDKSVVMLSTFFIYAEHRSGGIGREAVEMIEALARVEPYGSSSCGSITVHTASRNYLEEEGEDWRGLYEKLGRPLPDKGLGRSNEDWYTRMGYVKWKDQLYYKDTLPDGTDIMLLAAFLRKNLG